MAHLPAGRSPALPRAGRDGSLCGLEGQTHSHLGITEPVSMALSCLASLSLGDRFHPCSKSQLSDINIFVAQ